MEVMKIKKIISTTLILLISNYSISCYSSQQVSTEDGWVRSNEKIVSVMDKNGIEIRFYKNSGRYIPEERVISGTTIRYGRGKTQQKGVIYGRGTTQHKGVPLKVSLDDIMWVKVNRIDGVKTIQRIIIISVASFVLFGLLLRAGLSSLEGRAPCLTGGC